jgi:hypothetical protein
MNAVKTQETQKTNEQLTITSQRVFPAAPYPRKHVHCVFDNLQDVAEAVQALQSAGYNDDDIHVMSGWDFSTAIEQRYTQQSGLLQSLTHLFFDYGFDNMYLHEARRGHHIVSVRPASYEQLTKVAAVLARHHARVVKYIGTWTMAELVP